MGEGVGDWRAGDEKMCGETDLPSNEAGLVFDYLTKG